MYSNAFNFASFLQTGVDLRTGQYSASFPLVSLRSFHEQGSEHTLTLGFSMMNPLDVGFGIGWGLSGLSSYTDSDIATQPTLSLSTGETYLVEPLPSESGEVTLRDKKLNDVYVYKQDANTLLVAYKDGTLETLSRLASGVPFQQTVRQLPSGERFTFEYAPPIGQVMRLASILDSEGVERLRLDSSNGVQVDTIYTRQSATTESQLRLQYINGALTESRRVSSEDDSIVNYTYIELGEQLALASVTHPLGGQEQLVYQIEGHQVGSLSQTSFLPYVIEWKRIPGGTQPLTTLRYTYSADTNFTGFPFNGSPSLEYDNLYDQPGEYDY
ncbi:hypothetical protein [Vibrio paucivorans]